MPVQPQQMQGQMQQMAVRASQRPIQVQQMPMQPQQMQGQAQPIPGVSMAPSPGMVFVSDASSTAAPPTDKSLPVAMMQPPQAAKAAMRRQQPAMLKAGEDRSDENRAVVEAAAVKIGVIAWEKNLKDPADQATGLSGILDKKVAQVEAKPRAKAPSRRRQQQQQAVAQRALQQQKMQAEAQAQARSNAHAHAQVQQQARALNGHHLRFPGLLVKSNLGGDMEEAKMRIGKYTLEERRHRILRYRQKRHERNFNKKIKYACRKTLADSRPRVRGRFAKGRGGDDEMDEDYDEDEDEDDESEMAMMDAMNNVGSSSLSMTNEQTNSSGIPPALPVGVGMGGVIGTAAGAMDWLKARASMGTGCLGNEIMDLDNISIGISELGVSDRCVTG
eukprot:gene3941-4906_t